VIYQCSILCMISYIYVDICIFIYVRIEKSIPFVTRIDLRRSCPKKEKALATLFVESDNLLACYIIYMYICIIERETYKFEMITNKIRKKVQKRVFKIRRKIELSAYFT
jgi:hypothetical protein